MLISDLFPLLGQETVDCNVAYKKRKEKKPSSDHISRYSPVV